MLVKFGLLSIVASVAGLAIASAQAEAASIECHDPVNNQFITLSTTQGQERDYFNGSIKIIGDRVINWLEQGGRIPDNKVNCFTYIAKQCEMKARVSLEEQTAFQGGRFENSFRVFPDFGGVKLVAYVGNNNPAETERTWWFPSCSELRP
jgi:hypothetical protein